jgi:uncharacterized DUF497 family protein
VGFEWDAAKAKTNVRSHGVRFEESRAVFDDPWSFYISRGDVSPKGGRK